MDILWKYPKISWIFMDIVDIFGHCGHLMDNPGRNIFPPSYPCRDFKIWIMLWKCWRRGQFHPFSQLIGIWLSCLLSYISETDQHFVWLPLHSRQVLLSHMACQVGRGIGGVEEVTFLYRLTAGACPKSYGVNVARLAGKSFVTSFLIFRKNHYLL